MPSSASIDSPEYRVGIPTTPILLLRFPDGDVEYRTTRGELPIGALIRSRGTTWRVRRYEGGTAFLEAAEDGDGAGGAGASAGPGVLPFTLGDEPLTVEVLAEA